MESKSRVSTSNIGYYYLINDLKSSDSDHLCTTCVPPPLFRLYTTKEKSLIFD